MEHTSELELAIEAPTERDVFLDALRALRELIGGAPEQPATTERAISIDAPERAALLAGWLEELLFLAESEGFEPIAVERLDLGADGLRANVFGTLGEPPPLVKAVTYHRLTFECRAGGCRATVVLDV